MGEEGTYFDAELVEFGLDVLGDAFFELLTALEKFFHGHLRDEDTVVRTRKGSGGYRISPSMTPLMTF